MEVAVNNVQEALPRTPTAADAPTRTRRVISVASLGVVAVVAFAMRLVPVLTGGGLYGQGNYDDGVYYAAAVGLVHGLLPYRDFLLLHPPGILLVLAPFALLAHWVGDPTALAVGRVGFMIIGTANALLVATALRRLGLVAAVTGGLVYAVFFPAVYVEHSTVLEPVATIFVLGAVVLVGRTIRTTAGAAPALAIAGLLLGFSASVKIWGVVPAAVIIIWTLCALGGRGALTVLAGALVGATVVCLPFFRIAPTQMSQMVLVSQLGRPRATATWSDRTAVISGLTALSHRPGTAWLLLAALVVGVSCALAWRSSVGRLSVLLLVATVGLLFATPTFFLHYGAVAGGPLALVIGSAAGQVARSIRRPVVGAAAGVVLLAVLTSYAQVELQLPFGQPFPTTALAPTVATVRCVTTDNPISLIELDVISRNIDRRCPFVADLGGYSYDMQPHRPAFVARRANVAWQSAAVDYLRSGGAAILMRFSSSSGFSRASAATVRSWPVIVKAGDVTVRRPRPRAVAGPQLTPLANR